MKANKLLDFNETKEFIETVGGKEAVRLVKICSKKKRGVSDEEIAGDIKLKITEVRAILNRLHYRGIACYQKTKNNTTGWFSYTWEIKLKRVAELLLERQAEEITRLEQKLDFEKNYEFFACKESCEMVPFEVAAEYQFKCPKCGSVMENTDNKGRMRGIRKNIKLLNLGVKEINKYT
ncbi:MAG: hypothetical protein ABIE23_04260 [archaeon]|nr:hypothetical protein [Candidatus Micrarchaeota archaeon]